MTIAAMTRVFLVSMLFTGAAACRDVGVVGEGSACAEGCDANERCVSGACVPRNDGVAGADEHEEDEHEEDEHEEEDEEEPSESEEP